MAKTKNKKPILYPVFFMILVTVIFTTALALVNDISKDRIKELNALKLKTNVLYVLGYDIAQSPEALSALYDQSITEKKFGDMQGYIATENGTVKGYAFPVSGPGLWGSIKALAAVSADLKTVLGISFLFHSETPGLGGRIEESWYKEQFRNIPINGAETYIYKPKEGGNIDSISGATQTSDAVQKLINSNLENALSKLGGGM